MNKTLSKPFFFATLMTVALFGGGLITSVSAGPERYDNPKDKMLAAPEPVCDPRWYISIGGSVDYGSGDFSKSIHDTFTTDSGIGTSGDDEDDEDDTSTSTELDIRSRDWDDVYSNWWNVQGEVGYVLTDHIEIFGNFRYTQAEAKLLTGDVIFVDPSFGLSYDLELLSKLDDYRSFGGELGIRYFFLSKEAKIRPYVSIAGGATFVDAIGLRSETEFFGDNITFYEGPFYDDTVVGTASALLGVEFRVTCHLSVGLDAGVRWESELDPDDHAFASSVTTNGVTGGALGVPNGGNSSAFQQAVFSRLETLNNDNGPHLSFPVTVYAKVRF